MNKRPDLVLVPTEQLQPIDTVNGFQVRPGFFRNFGATAIIPPESRRTLCCHSVSEEL